MNHLVSVNYIEATLKIKCCLT